MGLVMVALMLYLDSRKAGECPERIRRRRESGGCFFLKRLTKFATSVPGHHDDEEKSTAWPGVSRPTHLAFWLQMEHGWMHDFALRRLIRSSAASSQQHRFSIMRSRNICSRPATMRWCKRSLINKCPMNGEVRIFGCFMRDVFISGKNPLWQKRRCASGTTTRADWELLQLPRHDGLPGWSNI